MLPARSLRAAFGDLDGIATPTTPRPPDLCRLHVLRAGRRTKARHQRCYARSATTHVDRQGKARPEMDGRAANRQLQGAARQTRHQAAAERLWRRSAELIDRRDVRRRDAVLALVNGGGHDAVALAEHAAEMR